MVTPGFPLPKIMFCIGEGPRSSGKRDGCTLSEPCFGRPIISFGKILPKDATINTSASGNVGRFLVEVTFRIGERPTFSNSSNTYSENLELPKKMNLGD